MGFTDCMSEPFVSLGAWPYGGRPPLEPKRRDFGGGSGDWSLLELAARSHTAIPSADQLGSTRPSPDRRLGASASVEPLDPTLPLLLFFLVDEYRFRHYYPDKVEIDRLNYGRRSENLEPNASVFVMSRRNSTHGVPRAELIDRWN